MKKNSLQIYMITGFILFLISFLLSYTNTLISLKNILTVISSSLGIIFIIFSKTDNIKSLIFGLLFSIFLVGYTVFTFLTDFKYLSLSFLLISVISFNVYSLINSNEKIKIKILILSILVSTILILFITKIITVNLFLVLLSIAFLLSTLVNGIIGYMMDDNKHKPSRFFEACGSLIFTFYILSSYFISSISETALIYSLFNLSVMSLLIPSMLLITISFTLFEQHEA